MFRSKHIPVIRQHNGNEVHENTTKLLGQLKAYKQDKQSQNLRQNLENKTAKINLLKDSKYTSFIRKNTDRGEGDLKVSYRLKPGTSNDRNNHFGHPEINKNKYKLVENNGNHYVYER